MIPSQKHTALIEEALMELSQQGIESLSPALEKIFNELMLVEREQALQASAYERTDQRKGYSNGFKNKTLQTRFGQLNLEVPKARDCALSFLQASCFSIFLNPVLTQS